jgi:amino acid transporter
MINVFGAKIIHWMQNVNVYWHVVGVAAIVLILVFIPEQHQSLEWMFTTQINNSGWTSYWFYVLPLGFLLTQYTITGFDASAHVSEETSNASIAFLRRYRWMDLVVGSALCRNKR